MPHFVVDCTEKILELKDPKEVPPKQSKSFHQRPPSKALNFLVPKEEVRLAPSKKGEDTKKAEAKIKGI